MKGTSKLLFGATLATVVILAIVLGLVLVLLAELYCSLLFRRLRKRKHAAIPTTTAYNAANAPPLSTFYSHGVLHAPRSVLFPAIPDTSEVSDLEKQAPQSPISHYSPSNKFVPVFSRYPWQVEEQQEEVFVPYASTSTILDAEQLIYISNPIYNNEANMLFNKADISNGNTPFETPDSSPSRLETADSSCSSSPTMLISTPPLTPMKDIPVQVESSSISLRDVRSLCTTGSDSNSNNDGVSSSSSGSPSTSPSW